MDGTKRGLGFWIPFTLAAAFYALCILVLRRPIVDAWHIAAGQSQYRQMTILSIKRKMVYSNTADYIGGYEPVYHLQVRTTGTHEIYQIELMSVTVKPLKKQGVFHIGGSIICVRSLNTWRPVSHVINGDIGLCLLGTISIFFVNFFIFRLLRTFGYSGRCWGSVVPQPLVFIGGVALMLLIIVIAVDSPFGGAVDSRLHAAWGLVALVGLLVYGAVALWALSAAGKSVAD